MNYQRYILRDGCTAYLIIAMKDAILVQSEGFTELLDCKTGVRSTVQVVDAFLEDGGLYAYS